MNTETTPRVRILNSIGPGVAEFTAGLLSDLLSKAKKSDPKVALLILNY